VGAGAATDLVLSVWFKFCIIDLRERLASQKKVDVEEKTLHRQEIKFDVFVFSVNKTEEGGAVMDGKDDLCRIKFVCLF
jgi:hypothetical protein